MRQLSIGEHWLWQPMQKTENFNPRFKSSGFILTIIVLLVVLGRWGWVFLEHSAVRKTADELNIPGDFWGAPVANHANTAFIFGARSENGINVYLHHDPTNNILLGAFTVGEFNALTLRLLAWSPDDKECAYTHDGGIFICDGDTGSQTAALNAGGDVANFAWLSPSRFVVLNNLNLDEFDCLQTQWTKKRVLTLTNHQPVTAFSALTDHSVVWRQAWDVWTYDFHEEQPVKMWCSMSNPLVDFSVGTGGDILLNCGRCGGSLIGLNPFIRTAPDTDLATITKLDELDTNNCFVFRVSSINQGKGRVYLITDSSERDMSLFSSAKDKTLLVKKDDTSKAMRILGAREIVDYSVQGNRLYVVGSQTNEPSRIWEYDLDADSLTCAYSSWPKPKYATLAEMQYCIITNIQGKVATTYRLWSPVHFMPGRKYPLMIEQTAYKWQVEPQVAANCGCYFAIASRPTWGSSRIHDWSEDVLNVYQELAKNPNIDTNRVFLYGVSAEANYVNHLLTQEPGLWKGAYLEGAPGPDPSAFNHHPLAISIVVGKEDQGISPISHYLERAVQSGQSARVVVKGGGHSWLSGASLRVSARSLAEFLTGNQ